MRLQINKTSDMEAWSDSGYWRRAQPLLRRAAATSTARRPTRHFGFATAPAARQAQRGVLPGAGVYRTCGECRLPGPSLLCWQQIIRPARHSVRRRRCSVRHEWSRGGSRLRAAAQFLLPTRWLFFRPRGHGAENPIQPPSCAPAKAGFAGFIAPLRTASKQSFRVWVGPTHERTDAERLHTRVHQQLGYSGMVVRNE